jgi:hypothetical protein
MNTLTREEMLTIHASAKRNEDTAKEIQMLIEAELNGRTAEPVLFVHDLKNKIRKMNNNCRPALLIIEKQ